MRLDFTDIADGFILADAELAPQSEWFEPGYWRSRGTAGTFGGGRGQAVSAGEHGQWVLRHYHRGGLPGRVFNDGYLWTGANSARPVNELRVLTSLVEKGAPVPGPVAARVLRTGFKYRGDLLTTKIPDARTLADSAATLAAEDWGEVGRAIRRFHAAGGWHADLNAHNILLAPRGVFIIDLDRGRLVTPGTRLQRRNLDRLERSLLKLSWLPGVAPGWQQLLDAWRGEPTDSG